MPRNSLSLFFQKPLTLACTVVLVSCGYSPVDESGSGSPTTPTTPTTPVLELPTLPQCEGECVCEPITLLTNDTGVTFFGDVPSENLDACSTQFPYQQDCNHGRDAQVLQKQGRGEAGFDFSYITEQGNVAIEGQAGACVLDNQTGLMWEVKQEAKSGQWRDAEHTYTWTNASFTDYTSSQQGMCSELDQCDTAQFVLRANSEKLCGFDDWRLPSRIELQDLVNYGQVQPTSLNAFFPNTKSSFYWSSTIDADDVKSIWAVDFNYGRVAGTSSDSAKPVRLVRTHQSTLTTLTISEAETNTEFRQRLAAKQRCNSQGVMSAPIMRYKQTPQGDVYDRLTGLIWQRCVIGLSGNSCETGEATLMSWQAALEAAHASNEQSTLKSNWRVPNIKELQVNIETQCEEPPLNPFAFPNIPLNSVWSSTPHKGISDSSYQYQYQNGIIFYSNRVASNYVHLVRDCIN